MAIYCKEDRTAILQAWANKRLIQKYKCVLVKEFERVANQGQTFAGRVNFWLNMESKGHVLIESIS